MTNQSVLMHVLHTALSAKRPHKGIGVHKFMLFLVDTLPRPMLHHARFDKCGNLHVDARGGASKSLFVAHVDTVHKQDGKNKIRKNKHYWHAKGDVLGADDGAGVAMLMHMMHAGIKGYYVFTQGEEKGGIGAKFLFDNDKDLLAEFDRAIAFDRRGLDSVITHQGWGRCCSDTFGEALCLELGKANDNLMHLNDDTGVYTDTAEFTSVIPECTNISVGYDHEHSQQESLNIVYFQQLANAVLLVDWEALPTDRDPTQPDPKDKYAGFDWQDYGYGHTGASKYTTTYTGTSNTSFRNDPSWAYDASREAIYDDLLDFKYGHTTPLLRRVAEVAYPDDPELAIKHMNPRCIDEKTLDDLMLDFDDIHPEDFEYLLLDLFDLMHVA